MALSRGPPRSRRLDAHGFKLELWWTSRLRRCWRNFWKQLAGSFRAWGAGCIRSVACKGDRNRLLEEKTGWSRLCMQHAERASTGESSMASCSVRAACMEIEKRACWVLVTGCTSGPCRPGGCRKVGLVVGACFGAWT